MESTKQAIREYLMEHRVDGGSGGFTDEESLLEAGVLDSMMMVDLIAFLEQEFGIAVSENDMVPENFDSLNAVAVYVTRKRTTA